MSWRECKLGEFLNVKHGYAFKGEHFTDSGEFVLLTPGNCHESGGLKLKGEKEKYYNGEFPPEYLLDEGELIVVMTDLVNTAPVLGGAFTVPESGRFLHNQRLGLVRITDEKRIQRDFLFYLLNSRGYRAQVRGSASGATVRHTSPGRIKDCTARIPDDLKQQKRIACVLSACDDLMENNRRRMALLEESARLLYREWFVRLRFPGHERARIVNGLPVGWKSTTIGAFIERGLIELQTGPFGTQLKASHYTETGSPVINVRNIGYGDIRADKLEFVPDEVRDRLEVHVLKAGDIVFGRKGAVDRHVLITSAQEGWVQGSDCIRLRVLSDEVSPVLLSFAFREESHHDWMLNQCGNKATMASLNQDVVSRIPVVAADTQVQRDFQDFAADVLKQIANLALQNQRLRTARDHLLPRLMSGELAV